MSVDDIRVLLVEDNPIDAGLLEEELAEVQHTKFSIETVSRLSEAIKRLNEEKFDITLLDLGLPDSHGLETFTKAYDASKGAPIVVLSGLDDENMGIEAVRKGAQDYLIKGKSDRYILVRAILHGVQRHQLLSELELSKKRLSAQYKWIPVPTYIWEKTGDDFALIDLNNAAEHVNDFTLRRGANASGFSQAPNFLPELNSCYKAQRTTEREATITAINGEKHFYQMTYVYVPPKYVMCHAEDLTDRKKAEHALKESEERFRAIFEGAQDCIFIKDRSLRYTHVNPAMERIFEIPAHKFIGKTEDDLFPQENNQYVKDVENRVLNGDYVEEEHTRKVNGMPVTFNEVKVPMRNAENRIIGLCGIARNMTERKKVEVVMPEGIDEYPSEAMRGTLNRIRVASDRDTTILLLGESGSGKDYLARYIHEHSKRSNGPFFAINCAAVSPELAESELFGHERGAFTGAHGRKRGLLELAEGGTLLLNEIGELTLALQVKLLTFLDTRQFTRVGGEKNISVNARLITATNRNLEKEVEAGRFRQDLYYRLNVISITIPPLRERRADIPLLIKQILEKLRTDLQLHSMPEIDSPTMNALLNYHWPGNVRELRNVLERALMLSDAKGIYLSSLGIAPSTREWAFSINFPKDPNEKTLNDITKELKSSLVNEALRRAGGSRQGAAKLLGISRYSLKHYMNSLDLNWDNGKGDMDLD